MATFSRIEWTEMTWNPVRGCSVVSPGCTKCYAMRQAHRFSGPGKPYEGLTRSTNGGPVWSGIVRTVPRLLEEPLRWRTPRTVFVNSMSDLFHEEVPTEFVAQVFEVMARAHWHRFQILTKRSRRLVELADRLPWRSNIWMGVSVESARYAKRIDHLRETPAAVRFLSLEPLLGPMDALDLSGVHWVIVGGESGAGARRVDPFWVRSIRDQCVRERVPFFFKQWGGVTKKRNGRILDGRTWDELPSAA